MAAHPTSFSSGLFQGFLQYKVIVWAPTCIFRSLEVPAGDYTCGIMITIPYELVPSLSAVQTP